MFRFSTMSTCYCSLLLMICMAISNSNESQRFMVFSGEQESNLTLGQHPELLSFAALTGDSVIIPINASSQTAIIQHGVFVSLWCQPWLDMFPGGSISWSRLILDYEGNILSEYATLIIDREI